MQIFIKTSRWTYKALFSIMNGLIGYPMAQNSKELLNTIVEAINDKKGQRILAIDIRAISMAADYVVVAEGSVDRHLKAIANHVSESLDACSEPTLYREGGEASGWLVLDCFDVVVHLFLPEQRDKYRIENLWKEGTVVEIDLVQELEGTEHE